MEDAAIHETDIGDGNGLFAVFDGHGGNHPSIQASKSPSTSRRFSPSNSRITKTIEMESMQKH